MKARTGSGKNLMNAGYLKCFFTGGIPSNEQPVNTRCSVPGGLEHHNPRHHNSPRTVFIFTGTCARLQGQTVFFEGAILFYEHQ